MNSNKVALITGGSSGIGKDVAMLLAKEGYRIAVVASRDLAKAECVIKDICAIGGEARAYVADVRDLKAIKKLAKQVQEDFDGLDVLINAAGIFLPTPVGDMSDDVVNQMISVNLNGTINVINAVAPYMKDHGGGKIVNFSSIAGVTGLPTYSVYAATKAAIIMLTKSLAIELAPFEINVNAIAPGNTKSPMNEELRTNAEFIEVVEAMDDLTPSNRTFSNSSEIAGGVLFLISDVAKSMYGSILLMDEGLSAGLNL
ncbi:MAG: short-chain dehydrogenase [Alphaproteobacteria bacterium]|nr:MAG: short-chain dehydrogenase [Alphaproteobacteria bacterium]